MLHRGVIGLVIGSLGALLKIESLDKCPRTTGCVFAGPIMSYKTSQGTFDFESNAAQGDGLSN